jgi:hypothetical protein
MAAKSKPENADSAEVQEIAKALFIRSYHPRGNIDAWMVAVDCCRAATEFMAVATKIAGGMSADDIIAERQLIDEQNETQPAEPAEQTP